MKVICKYSGVEFKAQGFGVLQATSQHPLLNLPIIDLLRDVYPLYLDGRLNEPESRILFVAFLKHSDLVIFDHHASPTLRTIHHTMQPLLATLDWSLAKGSGLALPRFRITKDNADLRNIKQWIKAWNEARLTHRQIQDEAVERTAFLIRQEHLEKLINSAYRKTETYAGKLARWVCDCIPAPAATHEMWIEIFKLKEPAVFNYPAIDIKELLDVMMEKLDVSTSVIALHAIKHVRRLAWMNSKGLLYGLDDEDEEEVNFVLSREASTPFVMLSRHERMQRTLIQDAPTAEPREADYPTKTAYLIAKAKWGVAQQLVEKEKAREAVIKIVPSTPAEAKALEQRQEAGAGIDPEFDIDEQHKVDEAEGTYEEVFSATLAEALAKLEQLGSTPTSITPTATHNSISEEDI